MCTVLCSNGTEVVVSQTIWQYIPAIAHCVEDIPAIEQCTENIVPLCVDSDSLTWVIRFIDCFHVSFAWLSKKEWNNSLFHSLFLAKETLNTDDDVIDFKQHQTAMLTYITKTLAVEKLLYLVTVMDYLGLSLVYWLLIIEINRVMKNVSVNPLEIKKIFNIL